MKKQIKSALFSGVFSLLSAIPAFAGTWQQNGPVWTYTKDDGTKATSEWIQYKEKWYHFGNDSIMQTGWIKCDDKFYYLDSFGAMYENRWVLTGYYVGADGAWIPGYIPQNTTKVITDHSSDDDDDDDDRRSYSSIDSTNSKHQESTDYSGGSSSIGSSSELTPGQTGGPKHQESTNYSEGSSASSSSADTGYTNEHPSNESNSNSGSSSSRSSSELISGLTGGPY